MRWASSKDQTTASIKGDHLQCFRKGMIMGNNRSRLALLAKVQLTAGAQPHQLISSSAQHAALQENCLCARRRH